VVNLTYSNGLFDIEIPTGTAAAGAVITLDGNIGGPASTGTGDNHVIYGVSSGAGDPISMLLSGNLGFEPAVSAGVQNGDIILGANFNVEGRTVAEGGYSDLLGADFEFEANNRISDVENSIFVNNANVTSRFLAAGTHSVVAQANITGTTFASDVVLFGAEVAGLSAQRGGVLTVAGTAQVLAHDYGRNEVLTGVMDAIGGEAYVRAEACVSMLRPSPSATARPARKARPSAGGWNCWRPMRSFR
jgi:hypothetical protein